MDFELKVRKILAESCGWGLASVQLDTRLVEDLDMDSMELVEFSLRLEDEFDISVPDGTIAATMTVGDVVEAVKKLRGA